MSALLLSPVVAFVVALIVTPCFRQLSRRLRYLDIPDEISAHRVAVPKTGGYAIFIGVIVATGVTGGFVEPRYPGDCDWRHRVGDASRRGRDHEPGVWGAMERKVRLATAVSGVSERPELAPSDRFRYGERVASQQVDVLVAER